MKISTQNQSRFLSRDDLETPILATMDRVTEDATLRNPYILHFAAADTLKPFPMNVTNRRILTAAYGNETDLWQGQPVELYFNPSIPNPRNPEQPGGICVRIPPRQAPAAPRRPSTPPTPAAPPPAARPALPPPAARPTAAARPTPAVPVKRPAPPQTTLADKLAQAIDGFRRSTTQANLDKWWEWAEPIPFTDDQEAELTRGYHAAMERIAMAQGPAAVAAGVEEDIPF